MSQNEQLKMEMCECGHLHLTYKSMTLHFEKGEFLAYAGHLARMAARVSLTVNLPQTRSFGETKNTTSCH